MAGIVTPIPPLEFLSVGRGIRMQKQYRIEWLADQYTWDASWTDAWGNLRHYFYALIIDVREYMTFNGLPNYYTECAERALSDKYNMIAQDRWMWENVYNVGAGVV